MDESAREGDVMEEPSTRGLDRADKEGLDGGETKGEEAIRDQPSMDELKPEGDWIFDTDIFYIRASPFHVEHGTLNLIVLKGMS